MDGSTRWLIQVGQNCYLDISITRHNQRALAVFSSAAYASEYIGSAAHWFQKTCGELGTPVGLSESQFRAVLSEKRCQGVYRFWNNPKPVEPDLVEAGVFDASTKSIAQYLMKYYWVNVGTKWRGPYSSCTVAYEEAKRLSDSLVSASDEQTYVVYGSAGEEGKCVEGYYRGRPDRLAEFPFDIPADAER